MIPATILGGLLYAAGAIFGAGLHATEQKIVVVPPPVQVVEVREIKPVVNPDNPNLNYKPAQIRGSKKYIKAMKLLEETGYAYDRTPTITERIWQKAVDFKNYEE